MFGHGLREYRGQIIGWGLALIVLGLITVPSYEVMEKNAEPFARLLEKLPQAMNAFFGDMSEMINAKGFLTVKYYSFLPLMLGVFAVFSGTGLLSRDEESGFLDLVLAHPVHRWQIYFGRVLAAGLSTTLIVLCAWVGLLLGAVVYPISVASTALLWPLISVLAVLLVFQRFALVVSQLLPSRRLASFVSMLFLFASFFLTGLAHMNPGLKPLAAISPITYYQSGGAIDGLNVAPLVGLLLAAELLAVIGYVLFQRRDIRLSGEGSFEVVRKLILRG